MINLILIGSGGFTKEILGYLESDLEKGYLNNICLKGILDDSKENYLSSRISLEYLGKIKDYKIKEDDRFLLGIGSNPARNIVLDYLESQHAQFFTYIHSSCYVNPSAKIGEGLIMAPFCIINADVTLGKHALINSYSGIGHDCVIGDRLIQYPYAAINGDCKIGDNLTMGTKATVFPQVTLGNNCTITSHSYVKSNKGDNRFIHQKTQEIDLENR